MISLKDLTTVSGYECLKTTSKEARKCLRHLRKYGVLVYRNDDGPSLDVRSELIKIADHIGLFATYQPYELVIIDSESHPEFVKKI